MDVGREAQKTQLELYLDEPRVDRNAKLDILAFWKGNEFWYPELTAMARDMLSIPISMVASESILVLVDESLINSGVYLSLMLWRHWFVQETGYMQI